MRVLWVANLVAAAGTSMARPDLATFGGWIASMLAQLAQVPGLTLGLAVRSDCREMQATVVDGVKTYFLPASRDELDISADDAEAVLADFKPDLLHAEGTEMSYTRRFLRAWPGPNIVSMQGVLAGYEPYEYGDLQVDRMLLGGGLTEKVVALAMIASKHLRFLPRVRGEAEAFGLAKNLLGRTQWDRAYAYLLKPDAPYYSVNRILRPAFYEAEWSAQRIERRSLFIGNAGAARKGAHFVLRAVHQLRRDYPDIRLYIAGEPPEPRSPADWKRRVGYAAYLRKLIRDLDLEDRVSFTGVLGASAMAERMTRSHVYVLSSLIENSPNTLGEAMMVGAPVVAAYAGGAPSMATAEVEALFYRPNDPAEMALQIRRIFESDDLAKSLSVAARARARRTHDAAENRDRLLAAYRGVLGLETPAAKAVA